MEDLEGFFYFNEALSRSPSLTYCANQSLVLWICPKEMLKCICASQLFITSLKMTILRPFRLRLYFQHVSVTHVLMVQNFWNANRGNLILLL